MKKFIATIRNRELRGKLLEVLNYVVTEGDTAAKFERHATVVRTLRFFRHNGMVRARVYWLYILPYLSKLFSVAQKQQVLVNHYYFLQLSFSTNQLQLLFGKGLTCYKETGGIDCYVIRLKAVTNHLEFDGSLALVFELNGISLYSLGFSFAPGHLFDLKEKQVIFIASVQGVKNRQDDIKRATRFFKDNAIPVLLLKALEGMAAHVGIKACIGVAASAQLSSDKMAAKEKCYAAYDDFWLRAGGTLTKLGYKIDLPLVHKSIDLISQPHRNRTVRKRNKSGAVYSAVCQNWQVFLKAY